MRFVVRHALDRSKIRTPTTYEEDAVLLDSRPSPDFAGTLALENKSNFLGEWLAPSPVLFLDAFSFRVEGTKGMTDVVEHAMR